MLVSNSVRSQWRGRRSLKTAFLENLMRNFCAWSKVLKKAPHAIRHLASAIGGRLRPPLKRSLSHNLRPDTFGWLLGKFAIFSNGVSWVFQLIIKMYCPSDPTCVHLFKIDFTKHIHVHSMVYTMWKNEKFSLTDKIFREINFFKCYFHEIFGRKSVRKKFTQSPPCVICSFRNLPQLQFFVNSI